MVVQGKPERRERLASIFWPEMSRASAFAQLRQALWEIHRKLGSEWLLADREKIIALPPANLWLDIGEFRRQLASCLTHNHPKHAVCPQCIPALHKAVELYRGDFLEGFGLDDSAEFDDWQFFEREALRAEFSNTLEKLVQANQANNEYDQAIEYGRRWLGMDHLNEAAHRKLMEIHAQSGQRSAALRQYEECVHILQAELGIAPQPATQELHRRIQGGEFETPSGRTPFQFLSLDKPLTPISKPALHPSGSHLPIFPTPFIGRRKELDAIVNLLANPDCRILTLLGPGGIGKTRLAVQSAQEALVKFPQGVYFAPLAAVGCDECIISALAEALGLAFQSDGPHSTEQLLNYLREKRLLIILDNFEHLVESAPLAAQIVARAPEVKLLITSRQRLNLQGEWVFEISGMHYPLPGAPEGMTRQEPIHQYSAIQLFLQSARRQQPGYDIPNQESSALIRLTQLVEGTPLALELAASWVGVLSVPEITAEIEYNLDFLTSDQQDMPNRQRSLRAVFEQSWGLLNDREKKIYAQLSVFQGGFTRQAAQAVTGISPHELASLIGKSLLRRTPDGRFDMHELLRQYAAEKLALDPNSLEATNERHCIWYCNALERWGMRLQGPEMQQAVAELKSDLNNARLAWEWATEKRQASYLYASAQGWFIFFVRQMRPEEGETLFSTIRTEINKASLKPLSSLDNRLITLLLVGESWFNLRLGRTGESEARLNNAQDYIQRSEKVDENDPNKLSEFERAFYLVTRCYWEYNQGNYQICQMYAEQAKAIFTSLGEHWWVSEILLLQFLASAELNDQEQSNLYFQECIQQKRSIGDHAGMAEALSDMAQKLTFGPGKLEEAEVLFQQSNEILAALNDPVSQILALSNQDQVLTSKGNFVRLLGLRLYQLRLIRNLGDRLILGLALAQIGETYHMLGDNRRAEEFCRQGLAILEDASPFYRGFAYWFLGLTLLACRKLAEAEQAFLASQTLYQEIHRTMGVGSALAGLARVALEIGNLDEATQYAWQALYYLEQNRHYFWVLYALADLALIFARRGEVEQAVELYATLQSQPFIANSAWFDDLFTQPILTCTTSIPAAVLDGARRRGAACGVWQAVEALLKARDSHPHTSRPEPTPS
jgi:predicted ATPase/DNA-binding SARP family transcriptional activator